MAAAVLVACQRCAAAGIRAPRYCPNCGRDRRRDPTRIRGVGV